MVLALCRHVLFVLAAEAMRLGPFDWLDSAASPTDYDSLGFHQLDGLGEREVHSCKESSSSLAFFQTAIWFLRSPLMLILAWLSPQATSLAVSYSGTSRMRTGVKLSGRLTLAPSPILSQCHREKNSHLFPFNLENDTTCFGLFCRPNLIPSTIRSMNRDTRFITFDDKRHEEESLLHVNGWLSLPPSWELSTEEVSFFPQPGSFAVGQRCLEPAFDILAETDEPVEHIILFSWTDVV